MKQVLPTGNFVLPLGDPDLSAFTDPAHRVTDCSTGIRRILALSVIDTIRRDEQRLFGTVGKRLTRREDGQDEQGD